MYFDDLESKMLTVKFEYGVHKKAADFKGMSADDWEKYFAMQQKIKQLTP